MEQRNNDMFITACDIADMRKTAERINGILSAEIFDMQSARDVICEVNLKHPENVCLYNLISFGSTPSQPRSSGVSIDSASASNLKQDLIWKRFYLFAKAAGKGVDAIEKEWRERQS